MKVPVVFLVALVCVVASEGPLLCGRRLSEALKILCPKYEGKRSKWDNFLNKPRLEKPSGAKTEVDYDQWGWPWLVPRAQALQGSRGKRGVIEECCFKSCSREELLTFCPIPV